MIIDDKINSKRWQHLVMATSVCIISVKVQSPLLMLMAASSKATTCYIYCYVLFSHATSYTASRTNIFASTSEYLLPAFLLRGCALHAACAGSRLIFKGPLEQKNGVHHTLGSVAVQLGTKTWNCGATAWNPLDPPWNRAAEARGMDQALQF